MEIPDKTKDCAKRIQSKLGLASLPEIIVYSRPFKKMDLWAYRIDNTKHVADTAESLFIWDNGFNGEYLYPVNDLQEEYPMVFESADKNQAFTPLLTEILILFDGKTKTSAAYNYMITGALLNGEQFMAILSLYVRELFRGCGLASLIKIEEIRLARKRRCDFIHTWHVYDNPNLSSAMIPGLKSGFLLFQTNKKNGVGYAGDGSIHLRKYFNNHHCSEVYIEQRKQPITSPDQNQDIIGALLASKRKYKGKMFRKIVTNTIT